MGMRKEDRLLLAEIAGDNRAVRYHPGRWYEVGDLKTKPKFERWVGDRKVRCNAAIDRLLGLGYVDYPERYEICYVSVTAKGEAFLAAQIGEAK